MRRAALCGEGLVDFGDGAVGGEGGAFLPADEMGYVVARHVDGAVGFGEASVAWESIVFLAEVLDP
jgi:hypothetical protein